ncbi:hypothetical protein FGO68_gene8706 [Halteria grandinella]|uniref:Uncharacterized protein n=1 Tax=Halteria grandinella TaxID=5974 RepID=A0A8J8NE01_HALGN|nr:hypothetical protein FGO68_gene8706 [Halteria grandinella]
MWFQSRYNQFEVLIGKCYSHSIPHSTLDCTYIKHHHTDQLCFKAGMVVFSTHKSIQKKKCCNRQAEGILDNYHIFMSQSYSTRFDSTRGNYILLQDISCQVLYLNYCLHNSLLKQLGCSLFYQV